MKTGLGNLLAGSPLFGPAMHENPYPVYHELRARDPVHWDDALHAWILTHYDDVSWALTQLSSDRVTQARHHRGDLVVPIMAAANRDPSHFPDPDRLDVSRDPNHHLAFGHEHHYCAGAPLARFEGRVAFHIMLTECNTLELITPELRHHENFNLRGYSNLPIRLG